MSGGSCRASLIRASGHVPITLQPVHIARRGCHDELDSEESFREEGHGRIRRIV